MITDPGMSLFYPQTVFVSTTLAREDVRHSVCGRSSGSPALLATFPSVDHPNSGTKMLREFPFPNGKGQGHSGGPAPDFNGIPY
jgi:hypothetical protein